MHRSGRARRRRTPFRRSRGMVRTFSAICLALALFAFPPSASAVEPDEVLKDPALEERARVISKDLRCLVCQNQSIDDSDAPLAKDLRVLVRDRLKKGETNEQVHRLRGFPVWRVRPPEAAVCVAHAHLVARRPGDFPNRHFCHVPVLQETPDGRRAGGQQQAVRQGKAGPSTSSSRKAEVQAGLKDLLRVRE